MTYRALEDSIESGQPVELFRFTTPGSAWNYTDAKNPITYQTIEYTPRPIRRTSPAVTSEAEDATLTLTLPANDPLVNPRYTKSVPSGIDSLTIFRRHSTDPDAETIVFWRGQIASVSFSDVEAKVECVPLVARLRRPIPRRSFSAICAHVLYDRGCKVNDVSFRHDVEVTAINGATLRVVGAGIGSLGADFFVGGFLRDDTATDHRMVLTQDVIGGAELDVTVLLPFPNISVGAQMQLFAGCDHTISTCASKFNNAANFGGFPWVPTDNPFETGIGGG